MKTATGPRSKAASSCNDERRCGIREASLVALICLLLASLALLRNCGEHGGFDAPDAASSPLVDRARVPTRSSLEPAVESVDTDVSLQQLRLAVTDAALHTPDAVVRREAIFALSDRPGAANIQALEQALMDPDDGVRETAIEALVAIGGEEAARALGPLVHVGDVSSRLEAVDALGAIDGDIATASLYEALTDENDAVREAAAELLISPHGTETLLRRQNESE